MLHRSAVKGITFWGGKLTFQKGSNGPTQECSKTAVNANVQRVKVCLCTAVLFTDFSDWSLTFWLNYSLLAGTISTGCPWFCEWFSSNRHITSALCAIMYRQFTGESANKCPFCDTFFCCCCRCHLSVLSDLVARNWRRFSRRRAPFDDHHQQQQQQLSPLLSPSNCHLAPVSWDWSSIVFFLFLFLLSLNLPSFIVLRANSYVAAVSGVGQLMKWPFLVKFLTSFHLKFTSSALGNTKSYAAVVGSGSAAAAAVNGGAGNCASTHSTIDRYGTMTQQPHRRCHFSQSVCLALDHHWYCFSVFTFSPSLVELRPFSAALFGALCDATATDFHCAALATFKTAFAFLRSQLPFDEDFVLFLEEIHRQSEISDSIIVNESLSFFLVDCRRFADLVSLSRR